MDWTKPLHDARPMCFDCHLDARGGLQGKMGWAEATRCGVPAVGMAPPVGCEGFDGRYRYAAGTSVWPERQHSPFGLAGTSSSAIDSEIRDGSS